MNLILPDKREKAMRDITPYIAQQLSNHMNERMDVILITIDSKGEAMAIGTMPEGYQHQALTAIAKKLEMGRGVPLLRV